MKKGMRYRVNGFPVGLVGTERLLELRGCHRESLGAET